jgi:putative heme iron utilization protein
VGRRTAERLVEQFGDNVLDVIDHEPQRIEAVLPRGRAQAVLDGRRAEREGNDG